MRVRCMYCLVKAVLQICVRCMYCLVKAVLQMCVHYMCSLVKAVLLNMGLLNRQQSLLKSHTCISA